MANRKHRRKSYPFVKVKGNKKFKRGGKPRGRGQRGKNTKIKPLVDKSVSLFAYKRG